MSQHAEQVADDRPDCGLISDIVTKIDNQVADVVNAHREVLNKVVPEHIAVEGGNVDQASGEIAFCIACALFGVLWNVAEAAAADNASGSSILRCFGHIVQRAYDYTIQVRLNPPTNNGVH